MFVRMFYQICVGDVESIGITDEEVSVHVEARCDSGSGGLRPQKAVSRVCGEAACVYDSDGIEHGTSVLVENHIVANGVAAHLQTNALGFERSGIGAVVETFNRSCIHEVQLNESNSPFMNQSLIGLAQILLRPRMRGIQRV